MTILEQRFMETIPSRLKEIRDAVCSSSVRLVKVTDNAYVNPRDVSSICVLPDDYDDNKSGGRVNITMRNEMTFQSFFKTAEDAAKALGVEIG